MASAGDKSSKSDNYGACLKTLDYTGDLHSLALPLRIIGFINILAALPTLAINLSVLVAIMRTRTLRTKANAILSCLLAVNTLQGCFSLPWYGVIMIRQAEQKSDCVLRKIVGFSGASLAIISMLLVDLLSYERYVAITDPFGHEARFTETRIKAAVTLIWVMSLAMTSFLYVDQIKVVAVSFTTIIIVATYVFNVAVHVIIKRTVNKLRRNWNALHANVANASAQAAQEQQRKERRTTKFSVYVIFFLLACYLPAVLKNVVITYDANAQILAAVANTILTMHATLSPLLYIWQSPRIGRAVMRLWKCRSSTNVAASS